MLNAGIHAVYSEAVAARERDSDLQTLAAAQSDTERCAGSAALLSTSSAAFLANRAVVLTKRGGGIKLDRRLDLPLERNDELRMDPRLGHEMKVLLSAMEEE